MAEAVQVAMRGKSDEFRARQYRKASQYIRSLDFAVEPTAELSPLRKRLGPRTYTKVEEWLRTGDMAKAGALRSDPRVRELAKLCTIWGVGRTTAVAWRGLGLRSVADVRARAQEQPQLLTRVQVIGVRRFEDFQLQIPREEAAAIFERVAAEARSVFEDPALEVQCCGSYRRGKALCGDVDVLICSSRGSNENHSRLDGLVSKLAAQGFITDWSPGDRLNDSHHLGSSATFLGVCRLRQDLPHRRLDIKVWPAAKHAFALLHFTGSGLFNRSMRLYAQRLGYCLSDQGLCECQRVKGERVWVGPSVECWSERAIFSALGLDYVPPTQREMVPKCFEATSPQGAGRLKSDLGDGEAEAPLSGRSDDAIEPDSSGVEAGAPGASAEAGDSPRGLEEEGVAEVP